MPTRTGWNVQEVEALLKRRVEQKLTRGIAVALIAPDGKVEVVAAGDSGNASRPIVDGDTLFEIGSITKVFTATLLAQSVEEGLVKLDSTVREVLPHRGLQTPGVGDVTLAQLATHTSGLPRLPDDWHFTRSTLTSFRNPYANYSTDDLWSYLQNKTHEPRADYPSEYSNLGTGLLGQVLAEREGTNYEALVERRLLKPLGMTWSGIRTSAAREQFLAVGHSALLNRQPYWDLPAFQGAGALRSSVSEMAKFIHAHTRGSLAGAGATHTERVKISEHRGIALGWAISRRYSDEILWHNGGTGGFRTFAGFSRVSGRGVVVLSNTAIEVDDIGLHLLNGEFKIQANPRRINWTYVVIGVVLGTAMLLRVWFATDPARPKAAAPAGAEAERPPKRTLRERFAEARARKRITSKVELFWMVLEILSLLGLCYIIGIWDWVSVAGRAIYLVLGGTMLLWTIWRLRHLPWRDASQTGSRAARYFSRFLTIGFLAIVVWNLW